MAKKLKIRSKEDKEKVYKELKAKSSKLHKEIIKINKGWKIDKANQVTISQIKPAEVINGNLHTWLSAKRGNEELIHDSHFVFCNPPSKVDGVEDPKKAVKKIVEEAVMRQIGHKL